MNDSTVIEDSPRFSYRGLLIDTARHYIPVPILKKQIDAMSYNKFNVFHWYVKLWIYDSTRLFIDLIRFYL